MTEVALTMLGANIHPFQRPFCGKYSEIALFSGRAIARLRFETHGDIS
jgi:hypothetical protein